MIIPMGLIAPHFSRLVANHGAVGPENLTEREILAVIEDVESVDYPDEEVHKRLRNKIVNHYMEQPTHRCKSCSQHT